MPAPFCVFEILHDFKKLNIFSWKQLFLLLILNEQTTNPASWRTWFSAFPWICDLKESPTTRPSPSEAGQLCEPDVPPGLAQGWPRRAGSSQATVEEHSGTEWAQIMVYFFTSNVRKSIQDKNVKNTLSFPNAWWSSSYILNLITSHWGEDRERGLGRKRPLLFVFCIL